MIFNLYFIIVITFIYFPCIRIKRNSRNAFLLHGHTSAWLMGVCGGRILFFVAGKLYLFLQNFACG